MGDLDGLLSWTHLPTGLHLLFSAVAALFNQWLPWSIGGSGLGYLIGPSLFFGALCTVAPVSIMAMMQPFTAAPRFVVVRRG
ncbi:MAG TPA: hypothetical protein VGP82_22640 [Ktedonobacterales bacterium]|nr:hypothetical protein [Ktedonobacterales bacterium]